MEEPESRAPDPHQPEATHWNTPRDPRKSFLCPLCGASIQLKVLYGSVDEEVIAVCFGCRTAMTPEIWEYYKVMEILHGA